MLNTSGGQPPRGNRLPLLTLRVNLAALSGSCPVRGQYATALLIGAP